MEKESIETNLKRRSYRSCIVDAFRTIKGCWWSATKKYWKAIVFVIVAQGILGAWQGSMSASLTYVGFEFPGVQFAVFTVLQMVLWFLTYTCMYTLLNKKSMWWNIRRGINMIPLSLVFCLVYIALAAVVVGVYIFSSKDPANIPIAKLLALTFLVLPLYMIILLPLCFVWCRYMVEPESKLKEIFWKSYCAGFRSWGFIFITLFLTYLCSILFFVVMSMPGMVLTIVRNVAYYSSVANGDPVGLPSYFILIDFILSAWQCIICLLVAVFGMHVAYNIYGTVKCKMVDRDKQSSNKLNA